VLVVSRERINQLLPVVNVIPLTSRKFDARVIYPNEVLLPAGTAGLRVDSIALCYQIRTLDKGRLDRELGELDDVNLQRALLEAIRFQLDMWTNGPMFSYARKACGHSNQVYRFREGSTCCWPIHFC
jgi:mRNA interferase MazF